MRRRAAGWALGLVLVAVSSQAQTPTATPVPTSTRLALQLQTPGLTVGVDPHSIATGKLTTSGNADIVVANNVSADLSILFAKGNANFMDAVTISLGTSDSNAPSAVAVADVDGDTRLDILVTDELASTVAVLLNQGGGAFGDPQLFDTGSTPEAVVAGHFNNDTTLYVATANLVDDTVTVFQGGTGGALTVVQTVDGVGAEPTALASADFDNDKIPDLVSANDSGGDTLSGSISVLKGTGHGMFISTERGSFKN